MSDAVLDELRQALLEWEELEAGDKIALLARIVEQSLPPYRRAPTLPHIWVSDYPGGRPALRWSPEQQALPTYCLHCREPHDVQKLNDECWARRHNSRTSRRVPLSE